MAVTTTTLPPELGAAATAPPPPAAPTVVEEKITEVEELKAAIEGATVEESKGAKVLAELLEENKEFVKGEPRIYPGLPEERLRLAVEGQAPRAAIIACADSRVAPEIIFRQNIGMIFVIRAAGNTSWGPEVLGSLEYAVDHLKVDLVMVLGHTKCGAVGAACAGGDPLPGALGTHITNIAKGIESVGGMSGDPAFAVEKNVECSVAFLRKDTEGSIAKAEKENRIVLTGAVYNIETGEVKVL